MDIGDVAACYRVVRSRDRRFDGVFYTGVTSTGIYCRPSCPAMTPQRRHVTFHRTAAAAQSAGFRACRRCLPDATPGSPDWDVSADAAGRAMRLVCAGVVEREGVQGLARRVGYTPRHLHRLLVAELGAGPLALARARRAQAARVLIETTSMGFADVAFAAGFASVRQFNDTIREVYAASPTQLRGGRGRPGAGGSPGLLDLRLPVRAPYAAAELLQFLAVHAVAGLEAAGPGWYARTLRLPRGHGRVVLGLDPDVSGRGHVRCRLELADVRDLAAAVERCRRLLDADADPLAVDEDLGRDAVLAPLVGLRPGLRVPGQVDGPETAVRTVIGQQISVASATTVTARLVAEHGEAVAGLAADPSGVLPTLLFPTPATLAALDPATLPMVRSRGRTVVAVSAACADGSLPLDRSLDRDEVRARMVAVPGIGPWTAGYVAMRSLGHPDVFLPTDVGVRRALRALSQDPGAAVVTAGAWRPWRSYALLHLWTTLPMLQPPSDPAAGRADLVLPQKER